MGRVYRPVIIKDGRQVFKEIDVKYAWDVNIWGAEFWGYFFEALGCPVEAGPLGTLLPHNITGERFQKYKEGLGKSSLVDFDKAIVKAYDQMNEHRRENEPVIEPSRQDLRDRMDRVAGIIVPMFLAEDHVGVASDYCQEYEEEVVDEPV